MNIKPMKRICLAFLAVVACVATICANDAVPARQVNQFQSLSDTEQKPPDNDEKERIKGYPLRKRQIGTPMDVEWNLDNSFPKSGSVLEMMLRSREKGEAGINE